MSATGHERVVFLDCQVFDHLALDFTNRNLLHLVDLSNVGEVKILITSVVFGEISTHIKTQARSASDRLRSAGSHPFVARHDPALHEQCQSLSLESDMYEAGMQSFATFVSTGKVETIDVGGVDVSKVFGDYFQSRPPFGTGKKKNEFPDAFSLNSILKWATENEQAVTVVSMDGDLEAFCNKHPLLKSVKTLPEFLAELTNPQKAAVIESWLDDQWEDIGESVDNTVERWKFSLDGADGTVHYSKVKELDVLKRSVVEIEHGIARIVCEIEIKIEALITADPPGGNSFGEYHGESSEETGPVSDKMRLTLDVSVHLDAETQKPVELGDVEVISDVWPRIRVPRGWCGDGIDHWNGPD